MILVILGVTIIFFLLWSVSPWLAIALLLIAIGNLTQE